MDELTFAKLKTGDENALDVVYRTFYPYVVGTLIHKYQCNQSLGEDLYAEAILRFRNRVIQEKVQYSNLKAYILKTAINLHKERKRNKRSELKKWEAYAVEQVRLQDNVGDLLVKKELEEQLNQEQKNKMEAIQWAMKQLAKLCRELLTDSIIKGIRPRFLVKKYGYKNARVVTDKKAKCKKALTNLVQKKLTINL